MATAKSKGVRAHEKEILDFALQYPEAWLDHPWGENVAKVKKKVFLFLGVPNDELTLSVKLPESGFEVLLLPFTEPTGYGLGKSGWVTATFELGSTPPMGLIRAWIDESYRAVAPKTLVKALDAGAPAGTAPPMKKAKKTKTAKAASKAPARRKKA